MMNIYNAEPEVYINEELNRTIRVYKPIKKANGLTIPDMYIGLVYMMHPQFGQQELSFKIDVDSIEYAFNKFDESRDNELERLKQEAMKQQQEEKSKIITLDKNITTPNLTLR